MPEMTARPAALAVEPFKLAPCTGDGVRISVGMRFWDGNGEPGSVTFVEDGGWDFPLRVDGKYDGAKYDSRLRWWNLYSTPQAAQEAKESRGNQ